MNLECASDFTNPIAREAAAANRALMELGVKTTSRAEAARLRKAHYQSRNTALAAGRLVDIIEADED